MLKLNIGGITEAGLSKKNKTGNWSYFIPVVDVSRCNGCGICEQFCPESCVEIKEKLCIVNEYYCKGCQICCFECPQEAITMKEKGGAVT